MASLFRNSLLVGLCMLLSDCTGSRQETNSLIGVADSHSVLKRKNIDELTTAELAAYEHAVKMMREKSAQNPFDRTGFTWQAWVHNCTNVWVPENRELDPAHEAENRDCGFGQSRPSETYHIEYPGMCEHGKGIFLLWHRAEFYFYEKALQASDPMGLKGPDTKNVTVPYWNFTKPPSGKRYPKAFEVQNSTLYDTTRDTAEIRTTQSFTSPYLLAYQLYYLDWEDFGGYGLGGAGNYGAFEAQIHNPIHDDTGGNMGETTLAALDPLFFSFHAYIDYILEAWIDEHGTSTITGDSLFMRAQQDKSLPLPPDFSEGNSPPPPGNGTANMGRSEIYFDMNKLGYAYQPGPKGEFIPKATIDSLVNEYKKSEFQFGDRKMSLFSTLLSYGNDRPASDPNAIFKGEVAIPDSVPPKAKYLLEIVRNPTGDDYSFHADVYLHPEDIAADIGSVEFRQKYLAVSTDYWKLGGHHSTATSSTELTSNITAVIESLIAGGKAGENWQISLGITAEIAQVLDFQNPTVNIK